MPAVERHDAGRHRADADELLHPRRCTGEDVLIPNAGHYAMFETPIALATSIEPFLRG